ncbi:MAG: hypothetical protein AAF532_16240 [Planctomycetota bacterium]
MSATGEGRCPHCGCRLRLEPGVDGLPDADCPDCRRPLRTPADAFVEPERAPSSAWRFAVAAVVVAVAVGLGRGGAFSSGSVPAGAEPKSDVAAAVGPDPVRPVDETAEPVRAGAAAVPEDPAAEVVLSVVRGTDSIRSDRPPLELPSRETVSVAPVLASDASVLACEEDSPEPIDLGRFSADGPPPLSSPVGFVEDVAATEQRLDRTFAGVGSLPEVPFGRLRLTLAERAGCPIGYAADVLDGERFDGLSVRLAGGDGVTVGELLADAAGRAGLAYEVRAGRIVLRPRDDLGRRD